MWQLFLFLLLDADDAAMKFTRRVMFLTHPNG
jgi:hypothetical protein